MSRSSKSKADKQMDEKIVQFCAVTGASTRDAKRFLEKHKRLDIAIDSYYTDPSGGSTAQAVPPASTSKLNQLFDKYKDPDSDNIAVNGTINFCEDLGVDPEDVVLLAVAHDLKSPAMGEWSRKGWVDGWKALGCDSISAMKAALTRMRDSLGSDPEYFQQVYNYTFEFSRPPGQRSLAGDMAQGFWELLIPHGLAGGALAHVGSRDGDEDDDMNGDEGWNDEHTQWWFDFLTERGSKGVSKDTWQMFLEFVRTIDSKFEVYDVEAAWPSTLDDFVEYARGRIAKDDA
ncbi:Defective in cullin neddylation protein [Sparassis crispa]|uniref:Defective in cullin neddylation protein n=1 Tax=Sparassis crispa TaxID=139825 RepID=A0A401GXN3_9APHY|nr:Defective in cullin neddylation protein [Sparassis crispa]GBE86953.1 Defective in cullin neddylation protein [Sparassis crispa]